MVMKEIIWKYYTECANIVTSEYKSRIFKSLHKTEECLVVQRIDLIQNYGNADIINCFDAIYIQTENTTILE